MDTADRVDEIEGNILERRIKSIRDNAAIKPARAPKGACYFCDEPLGNGRVFCDADCHEDFDRLQRKTNRG